MPVNPLSQEAFNLLRQYDTCTLSNAIDALNIRPRNEGFISGTAACKFPALAPVLGYAVIGVIRASIKPMSGSCHVQDIEWWRYLASVPAPRIVVLQDAGRPPGVAAFFGKVEARICQELGCVAFVTNGAVRELPVIEQTGIQLFAGGVSVREAYTDVVDASGTIEIGGLQISSGDLLHGDVHGIHSIPLDFAGEIPRMAACLRKEERELFRLCDEKNFSVEELAMWLEGNEGSVSHQTRLGFEERMSSDFNGPARIPVR